jgi:hypothetical protein
MIITISFDRNETMKKKREMEYHRRFGRPRDGSCAGGADLTDLTKNMKERIKNRA